MAGQVRVLKINGGRYAGGVEQPLITQGLLKHLKCDIPSINQQQKNVSILSAYDSLIEVNNKRIKILEQMAENLYKEWFVRFRFPGHETAEFEKGIPKTPYFICCAFPRISGETSLRGLLGKRTAPSQQCPKKRLRVLDRAGRARSSDVERTRHSGGIWAESAAVSTTPDRAKKQACHPWFSDGIPIRSHATISGSLLCERRPV